MQEILTCSAESRSVNESLAGSVKPADVYFLIETNATEYGGWVNGIVKTATKSGNLAPYLQHLQSVSGAKVLFIRQPQANENNFYIALVHQSQPKIYHAMLNEYSDLLDVDLSTLEPNSIPHINGQAMTEISELYAVCTNGKHDACCSTLGVPVYNAMVQQAGAEKVWQASHIGGHRLAATMIAFPQGIYYGHLDPFNAEEVVTNHSAGYLLTYKYRGCSSYGAQGFDEGTHKAINAGEHHIRETAKKYAIDDLIFHQVESTGEMQWSVVFYDKQGKQHQVKVQTIMSEPRQSSCNEDPKPMPTHHLSEYQTT